MELHTFYAALSGDLAGALACMGSEARLRRYLQMLPEDEAVAALRRPRSSPQEIRTAAHQLRGMAGFLGLTQLKYQAEAVEKGVGTRDALATTRLSSLEVGLQRTLAYVKALPTREAHLRMEERSQWARDLGGMPGQVCLVHAETGRVVWGEESVVQEGSEAIWDAAWLEKSGRDGGMMVWPCRTGYAFCHREDASEPDRMSILGHDVRTPLHVIRSMTELALRSGGEMGKIEVCLERIEAAGRHLEAIMSGIGGKQDESLANEEEFCLSDMLGRAVAMIRPEAANRGITLQMKLNIPRSHVLADRGKLGRVIMNLLTNAVKHTESGGEISLACEEVHDGVYEMTVEDSGAGMSASFVRRAFEPYVQADAASEGMGLGLHIVSQLIHRIGGEIFVRSCLGSGTAISIRVPLKTFEREADDDARLDGLHILLVDDHAMSAQASAAMLESLGATVTLARTGAESLRCAQGQDCVLMDLHLPDMSGCEAGQRLHLRYPAQELPILAFTAENSAAVQKRTEACGMQGVISKPVSREALAGAILARVHRK